MAGTVKLAADKMTATVTLTAPVATNDSYKTFEVVGGSIHADGSTTDTVPAYATSIHFNDTTAPTVTSASYNPDGELFTINFSEPIKTLGTIKVYDENNVEVANDSNFTGVGTSTITLDTSAGGVALPDNKTYKVVIVGATDLADNFFANNRVEKTFKKEKTDNVAPTVTSVSVVNSKTVRVTFSEPVQVNPSTGVIGTIQLDAGAANSLKVVPTPANPGEAKEVTAGTVYDVLLQTTPVAAGAHQVTIAGFKDLQGNPVAAAVVKAFQVNADTTPASITNTEVANGVVTFTFNEEVALGTPSATLVTPDNVQLSVGAPAFTAVAPNKIEVNLSSVVPSPTGGNYTLKIASGSVVDTATPANTQAYQQTFALTADTVKPTVTAVAVQSASVASDNDTVDVTFSEPMDASALDVNNYLLDGQKVFESAIFVNDKQHVQLTLKPGIVDITGNRVLTIQNVKDLAGNTILKVNRPAETYVENVKPLISKAELLGTGKVVVTFSESVVNVGGATTDLEVYADGSTTAKAISIAPQGGTSTTVYEITITGGVTDLTKPVTLKVLSGNDIEDNAGNVLGTTGTVNVTQ